MMFDEKRREFFFFVFASKKETIYFGLMAIISGVYRYSCVFCGDRRHQHDMDHWKIQPSKHILMIFSIDSRSKRIWTDKNLFFGMNHSVHLLLLMEEIEFWAGNWLIFRKSFSIGNWLNFGFVKTFNGFHYKSLKRNGKWEING